MTDNNSTDLHEAGFSRAEDILDGVYLRYDGAGHIRFSLPRELCTDAASTAIERGLVLNDGVYRVKVNQDNQKLSIRFREAFNDKKGLSQSLREIVLGLPEEAFRQPPPPSAGPSKKGSALKVPLLLGELLKKKEAVQGKIMVDEETEKKALMILNELVVFYLVRHHWDVIMNKLIKQPFRNAGGWLSITYLLFLYVRHKKEA